MPPASGHAAPVDRVRDLSLALQACPLIPFQSWPDQRVPQAAAGVYTVWRGDDFIYVGMAGRGLDEEGVRQHAESGNRKGLADRLGSHASGRRSGDQFCVYVADRLVLPTLTAADIRAVGEGALSLDEKVREYIRANLAFRFVTTRDGREAAEVERAVRRGALPCGKPLLNPLAR